MEEINRDFLYAFLNERKEYTAENADNLSKEQIERYGRFALYCGEVFDDGTKDDRKDAIAKIRRALKEGKTFSYGRYMNEGVYDAKPTFNRRFFFQLS